MTASQRERRISKLTAEIRALVLQASQAGTPESFRSAISQAAHRQQEVRRLKTGQPEATK